MRCRGPDPGMVPCSVHRVDINATEARRCDRGTQREVGSPPGKACQRGAGAPRQDGQATPDASTRTIAETRSEVKVKNHTAKKEKPASTNWEGALIRPRPPQSRPRLKERNTYPQPIPRPDDKLHWLPVGPRPRPLPPPDKKLRRFATLLPVPEFTELTGSKEIAGPSSDVKSMRSSQEESPSKSKMEQQIS